MDNVPTVNPKSPIFKTQDPVLTVRRHPVTGNYTLNLHYWDSDELADGYSVDDARELIYMLEQGILHLNTCVEEESQDSLFEELKDGKETSTRGMDRGTS
tara:strand:+ start:1714 stop:2013 length:300 start_codon:yes stop_codon:yes gene_type:complete